MKPRVIALTLFALAGLVLWWRSRGKTEAMTTPEQLEAYKGIVEAFKPGAPTIIERSPIDAANEGLATYKALTDRFGIPYRAYVQTAEGGWLYQKDMSNVTFDTRYKKGKITP